jgi:4'-phosphopantetheinyl transferase
MNDWHATDPKHLPRVGEVHIWRIMLEAAPTHIEQARQQLSPDECERADRFVFTIDRERFILGRAWLRNVLAGYLHCRPQALQFAYNRYGKPALNQTQSTHLHFNLSHSRDRALLAIASDIRVGIDIEAIREIADKELVTELFSAREQSLWYSLPASEKQAAFFAGWTRKEAWVKAHGAGLTFPLVEVEAGIDRVAPTHLVDPNGVNWEIHPLALGAGYAAAVAVETRDAQLQYFEGTPDKNSIFWEMAERRRDTE